MNKISTRKALNPAYRKHKPLRKDITSFVEHLKVCIEAIKISDERGEHEEHLKEPIKNFLQKTFYSEYLINTKDRIDLAIYLDKTAKSDVGVIIEAKRPSNKAEFITPENLNKKALQELLLYYLRERLDGNNNNIKHLIITNGFEWFFFKAEDFYNYFYKNKALIKEYESFRDGLKDTTKNELFYSEIAKKYIETVKDILPFVYINFSDVNIDKLDDNKLNTYFKIFSNVHLLGQSFGNDSNQLNKTFYDELLHIIGLEEISDGGKKIIKRKSIEKSEFASLLESTIFTLEERAYLDNVKSVENTIDKSFNVGLELCLTWINRILFLKLLESQLASYHKGAKEYKFLNSDFIDGFDELNNLFFSALAKKIDERHPRYADKFKNIPYLNSSLFERSELETETFEITALIDDEMKVFSNTILKDVNGKKFKGKLKTLDYLFRFLDAYDFATDGTEGIVDTQEHKTLINASVLGLIFEKINGYKDGSFYTPAYITMYMCKETIRRSVVQKFKDKENESIENFDDVRAYCHKFFKADDIFRFNNLVNSIRICDPAVGSGHFLVSALNELISIKNDLGILVDSKGNHLKVDVQIENDELYISDSNGQLFEYNPNDKESTRIQKTLFEEKQNLIENCLFGVDINPNSVKICRLRLWIELLKNAYYTEKKQLHTLPNIDINIKCGNSLISRFHLTDNLKNSFKSKETKYSFIDYKNAVTEYKNTNSKEKKQQVLEIINEVKNNIKSIFYTTLKENKDLANYRGQLINLQTANIDLFGAKLSKSKQEIEEKRLKLLIKQQEEKVSEITNNAIYRNAFEWRFEFPEVLDDDGTYIGFDVIIGNPPYVEHKQLKAVSGLLKSKYEVYYGSSDLSSYFFELALNNLKANGEFAFINTNKFFKAEYGKPLRSKLLKYRINKIINFEQVPIFDEALVSSVIIEITKKTPIEKILIVEFEKEKFTNEDFLILYNKRIKFIQSNTLNSESWNFNDNNSFLYRIMKTNKSIMDFYDIKINRGVTTGFDPAFLIDKELYQKFNSFGIVKPILKGNKIGRYYTKDFDSALIFTRKGINIEDYQEIKSHLLLFKDNLKPRLKSDDIGRKSGTYNWFEIQDNTAYYPLFDEDKIVWSLTSDKWGFAFDDKKHYLTSSGFFLVSTSVDLKYLLGLLNSKLLKSIFKHIGVMTAGGAFTMKKSTIERLPIKLASEDIRNEIINKVNLILKLKNENDKNDTTLIENEIDNIVYQLYDLSPDEINIIKKS